MDGATELTGFKKYVSIKGVLIGTVVNVIPSDIFSFVLLSVLLYSSGNAHPTTAEAQSILSNYGLMHPLLFQTLQIPGVLFNVIGGYVAARIAKRYEVLNATLSSWWCVISLIGGLFFLQDNHILPMWGYVATIAANILLSMLGGMIYLWSKGRRAF